MLAHFGEGQFRMRTILTADIGGTNSRFAHFEEDTLGRLSLKKTRWFRTGDAKSFAGLLKLLQEDGFSLLPREADAAVFAVAGPVIDGRYSSPPFIPWDIDISNAEGALSLNRSLLINDFIAQAFACRSPATEKAQSILLGSISPEAAVAVIGAGTALGKAVLMPDGFGGYVPVPSEGGHANFPFVSKREIGFQEFLRRELNEEYITANYVVSGRGLAYVHRFLTGEDLSPQEVTATFSPDSETLAWAARFYGRVCRNYALEVLARGGLYIAGGVAVRTPSLLTHKNFETEFRNSVTMASLLDDVPVLLMDNEESGLWGAALLAQQQLKRGPTNS